MESAQSEVAGDCGNGFGKSLDRKAPSCYNDFDNLIIHCVAVPAQKPGMLNKITGWESRTVPPLYVLTGMIKGESRSLGQPGKADQTCVKTLRHKSEDLRIGFSSPLRDYGV